MLHFDGIVDGLYDRVQVGEVDHRHYGRPLLEDAVEFYAVTVGCGGGGGGGGGDGGHSGYVGRGGDGGGSAGFARGYGHDLGLWVPVAADVVGHGLRVVRFVSGIGGRRAGQRREVANASGARLVRLVCQHRRRRRRRLVKRPEFGGHAVVNDVETHGGQRHAGQYVHRTEPHSGRTGERHHVERPRRVPESYGAEQHEAEEHAVQIRAPATAVQPVEHGRTAADVRGHEREADQQQWHEARAVCRG